MKKLVAALLTALLLITPTGDKQPEITEKETNGLTDKTFTAKLMQSMDEDENYFISPFSIKTALAMAANGADGATRDEIIETADLVNIDEYNSTVLDIITRYEKNKAVKLSVADSIWLNKSKSGGLNFTKGFNELVSKYYNGISAAVSDSDAVERINKWVNDNTAGKITEIIDSNEFSALLANAVCFKGKWRSQFNEYATSEGDFTNKNGNVSRTEFMNITESFKFYEDKNVQIIELPYDGDSEHDVSMFVVLSEEDFDYDIESLINSTELQYERVKVKMPKFRTETQASLKDILVNMGINEAFYPASADFSKMFTGSGMYIDEVLHKTYIDVDENGTEAAAVTAIMLRYASLPSGKPIEFNADRPFAYCIRENISGQILFAGEFRSAK